MATINWNTVPDYDEWGYDSFWGCEDWVNWHKKLAQHFGKETANDIWNYAFAKSTNLSSNLDCRTFNSSFRQYVNENNLSPYDNAGIFAPILSTYGTASDLFENGLSGISSFLSGDKIKTILNIALIGGVIFGGFYIYKSVKK